jgi:hypothetical protein
MEVEIMDAGMHEAMRQTLIKRALEEDSFKERQREMELCIQDTLGALEDITTLSPEELESLAHEVKRLCKVREDTFFSIKHQILLAGAFVGFASFVPLLGRWLF